MGWRETCAMDERIRFVMSCAAGEESFSALCRGYGVSRRTDYRSRAFGPVGLVDRSRAPHSHPNGTAEATCERVPGASALGAEEDQGLAGGAGARHRLAGGRFAGRRGGLLGHLVRSDPPCQN
jgi:hypothetical protein